MDGIKLMLVLVLAFGVERTYSQQPSTFRVLTGSESRELELGQNPELQEFLARTGERVIINITGGESTVILQEGVNALIDCLPFLQRFPGGQISWFFRRIDQFGNSLGNDSEFMLPIAPGRRLRVEGEFNRYLNIPRTNIVGDGARDDPDSGVYTCQVCVAEGTRFEVCRNATTRVYLLGAPPNLNCGEPNAGPVDEGGTTYQAGTNFCLNFDGEGTMATVDCALVPWDSNTAQAFPQPDRTWDRNGVVLYSLSSGVDPELRDEFLIENPYLTPGLVDPSGLPLTALSTGSLSFNHVFGNISMLGMMMGIYPAGIMIEQARRLAFENILGTWTCSSNNSLGEETCSTTIRECGRPPPVLPGCSGPLFPDEDGTVPVGCSVCIVEGTRVTLDCGVISGQTPEISYRWVRNGMEVSTERTLTVNSEGNYTCEVSNLNGTSTQTSMVFFSPRYTFSTSIATLQDDTLTTDTGCRRLRNSSAILGADRCILVGETITFECQGSGANNGVNISIMDSMGNVQTSPYTVTATLDNADNIEGDYTCRVDTSGPCGGITGVLEIRVYDPARINRVLDLPGSTVSNLNIGAGRSEQVVVVQQGQTATLYCPTSGRDEPQDSWREVVFDARGQASEQEVTPTRTENVNGVDTLVLEIPNFNVSSPRSYVCRTSNIAGVDAGVVTLIGPEGGRWETGRYSACEPYNCRLGTQTRSVVCRSTRDNRVLPDSECLLDAPRPPTTLQCTGPCFITPTWRAFPWGPCSKGCGGGYRTREVVCHIPRTGVVVPDSRCLETKPRRFEFCPNTCCVKDNYPSLCASAGTANCGLSSFQQVCCWTCQQRDGPH